jgi:hypothetical protein
MPEYEIIVKLTSFGLYRIECEPMVKSFEEMLGSLYQPYASTRGWKDMSIELKEKKNA